MTNDSQKPTTNDAGIPVPSDEFSLTVGPDGPILLQDHYLIEQMANFNRGENSRTSAACQGKRRVRPFRGDQGRQPIHQGRLIPAGRENGHAGPFFNRGRRARQPRYVARPARLRAEVLYQPGQLRHGREQHAGVLHPRPDEIPALHSFPKAPRRQQSARPRHAMGLLDAVPGDRSPSDLVDGRSRHSKNLAANEWLFQPHLHVGQRQG